MKGSFFLSKGFLPCLIAVWFTVGSIMVGRGVFFALKEVYGFGEIDNIWVGVLFGLAYIPGALTSRLLTGVRSYRLVLCVLVVLHVCDFLAMGLLGAYAWVMVVGFVIFSFLQGMMWPFVESYVTGGKVGREAGKAVASFSMSWAFMLPTGIVLMGAVKQYFGVWMIFYVASGIFVAGLFLMARLGKHPEEAHLGEVEKIDGARRERYRVLARASQWSMVTGYALHQLLAPVWPEITQNGLKIKSQIGQAALSGAMDYARALSFLVMWWTHRWYGKKSVVAVSVVGSVGGFLMIYLYQSDLRMILVGSILFGLTEGIAYFAALYYGILSQDSAHDGGAKHEAFVGLGFAIGPILGLVGLYLWRGGVMASKNGASLVGLSPVIVLGLWVVFKILYWPSGGKRLRG